jgi:hypothetical protein
VIVLCALAFVVSAPLLQAAGWEQVETRHFRFIFEPRDRPYVDELLTFSEEVYARVTGFFGSFPDKVPCIIRGRRDDANGLTSSFPSRIELYVKAPTDHAIGARTENWLRVLLTHELTHFVHQSMPTGLMHSLSILFGPDLSTVGLALLPGWAIEGPAVYDETIFTQGGRGRNPLFEVYSKAAAEEGRFFSLSQAGYPSAFPPPERIYVAGYLLIDWMQATYGPDTLRKIMTTYLDFPFFGPWHAIATVTGQDAEAVFAEMRTALQKRYAEAKEVRGGARITRGIIGSWTRPQATAQGLYAYHTGPDIYPSIVRIDPTTGSERVLVRAALTDDSSFSATEDGITVWFSSLVVDSRRLADVRTVSDLFVLDVGSAVVRRITNDAHLWHPAVSSDGKELVAVQGAGPYSRLVSVDLRTGSLRVLFSRAGGNVYSPAISRDGTRVSFIFNLRGMQDVYIADLGDLARLSVPLADVDSAVADVNADRARPVLGPDPYGEYFPSFIGNDRLLFTSDRSGALCLYVADLATGVVSLAQQDPVAAIAGISDGSTVTYTSYAGSGYCLKSAPLSPHALAPLSPEEMPTLPYPRPADWTGASVKAMPYFDFPFPTVWLPSSVLVQTGPSFTDLSVGVGAVAEGGSLLGESTWLADAAWLPRAGQPSVGFSASVEIGALEIAAASRLSYQYSTTWTESVESSLTFTSALINETVRDESRAFSVGIGVRHHAELAELGPFTFQDSLQAPGSAWFTYLAVPATVRWQWSAGESQIEFTPTRAVDAWLRATTFLPVLSLAAPQGEIDLFTALNLPSPLAHQVVKLGVKAAQYIGSPYNSYQDSFTVPRGSTTRTRSLPGGLLASIDYLVPIALLDQPLLLGFALTGAAFGLHAEGIANFSPAPASLHVLPAVFAGVELNLRFVYGSYAFPVGMGIEAEVSTSAPSGFSPGRDLRLYVFAGFDSFGGPASAADPARETPAIQRQGASCYTPFNAG